MTISFFNDDDVDNMHIHRDMWSRVAGLREEDDDVPVLWLPLSTFRAVLLTGSRIRAAPPVAPAHTYSIHWQAVLTPASCPDPRTQDSIPDLSPAEVQAFVPSLSLRPLVLGTGTPRSPQLDQRQAVELGLRFPQNWQQAEETVVQEVAEAESLEPRIHLNPRTLVCRSDRRLSLILNPGNF